MKFLSVRDLRGKSAQVWKELPREREMVVTNHGRPVAILSAVGEGDLEQSLAAWRRVRGAQAIAAIQFDSARKGTDRLTMDEIDAEIRKSRQERRLRRR